MSLADAPESLGQDLRVLRKRRGMTLVEVAEAMGRSVGWLSQVERNLSEPSLDELGEFACLKTPGELRDVILIKQRLGDDDVH